MQISKKQNFDWIRLVKIAGCVVVFYATIFAFSTVSSSLLNNYMMLFSFNSVLGMWFIKLCVYSLLLLLALGIISALVRPKWLLLLVSAVGAVLYVLVCGSSTVVLISAGILCLIFVWYSFFVVGQMENQINFSIHPLGDKKALVGTVLAALICVSLGLGYFNDATQKKYVLPPELTKYITDSTSKTVTQTINEQFDAQAKDKKFTKKQQDEFDKQKNDAITKANDDLKKSLADLETKGEPYKNYIAVTMGVFVFFIFQMLFLFVSMLLSPLLALAFFFMKVTGFTKEQSEKREVKWLVL